MFQKTDVKGEKKNWSAEEMLQSLQLSINSDFAFWGVRINGKTKITLSHQQNQRHIITCGRKKRGFISHRYIK